MTTTKAPIQLPSFISVRELSELMGVSPINVIKELMNNGIMANINQEIDYDTAAIVAEEMGFEVVSDAVEEAESEEVEAETEADTDTEVDADVPLLEEEEETV